MSSLDNHSQRVYTLAVAFLASLDAETLSLPG
jgi:hypothetical protein